MNKLILIVFMAVLAPTTFVSAQKHAPTLQRNSYLPGIYPETSKRILRSSDFARLTDWDMKIMRNEIYARHGYIFKTQDMIDYFSQQDWYYPRYNNVNSMLTSIEKRNINIIKLYE